MDNIIEWQDLGRLRYRRALALQDSLRSLRIAGHIGDRLLFVEHPPVFTIGRRECSDDFISSAQAIAAEGIEVVKTNRGGRVTYHGPGQLVGYFICHLDSLGLGVRDFVRAVEEICIRTAAGLGIRAHRDESRPGIWVGQDKLGAIGLNVSRGITQHGFALNVDCDLGAFRHITACGIKGRGITTMADILGRTPPMDEVKRRVIEMTSKVLSRRLIELADQPEVKVGPPGPGGSAVGFSSGLSS